ncbi:hypothetical protein J2W79_000557 [Methylorubrum extorquens]|nr:hypothetical protein [Methylorubrum extorquens]
MCINMIRIAPLAATYGLLAGTGRLLVFKFVPVGVEEPAHDEEQTAVQGDLNVDLLVLRARALEAAQ